MNDMNIVRFGEKWGEADPHSAAVLTNFINQMEEAIETYKLPAMMVADMHQVIANRLYSQFAEAESEGGMTYEQLSPGATFRYGAFEFIKPCNAPNYLRPVGGGAYMLFHKGTICHLISETEY